MKERLNLTIDRDLLEAMKTYAAGRQMSVSELVESYFRTVTRPVQRANILDLVEGLEAPELEGGLLREDEAGQGLLPGQDGRMPMAGEADRAPREGRSYGV